MECKPNSRATVAMTSLQKEDSYNSLEDTQEDSIKVYPIRWLFLFLLMVVRACIMYTGSFGVNSDVYGTFFNVSHATVDMLTVGVKVGSLLATPIAAFASYSRLCGLRRSVILSVLESYNSGLT